MESLRHHLAHVEEIYISLVKNGQDRQEADAAKLFRVEEEARNAKAAAPEAIKEVQAQADAAHADAALAREEVAKEIKDSGQSSRVSGAVSKAC